MIPPLAIRVHAELSAARPSWLRLEQSAAGTAFQSYAWAETWAATIGASRNAQLYVVELQEDGTGRPLMIFACAITRRRGLSTLGLLDGGVADYNLPLIDRDFARQLEAGGFAALWQRILRQLPTVDLVALDKLADSRDHDGIANPFLTLDCTRLPLSGHYCRLTDFASFQAGRPAKLRAKMARRRRQLEQMGRLTFQEITEPAARERLFQQMVTLKLWKYPNAPLSNPVIQQFYRTLALRPDDSPVQIFALQLDGKPIVLRYGLYDQGRDRGRHISLIASYSNGEHARLAPAALSIELLIQELCERGMGSFDLALGDEAYKLEWTNATVAVYSHINARSLPGLVLAVAPRRLKAWLKARIKATPWLFRLADRLRTLARRPSAAPAPPPEP